MSVKRSPAGLFALTIRTRCFAGRLAQTIHAYPTMSLAVQQAESQLVEIGRVLSPATSGTEQA